MASPTHSPTHALPPTQGASSASCTSNVLVCVWVRHKGKAPATCSRQQAVAEPLVNRGPTRTHARTHAYAQLRRQTCTCCVASPRQLQRWHCLGPGHCADGAVGRAVCASRRPPRSHASLPTSVPRTGNGVPAMLGERGGQLCGIVFNGGLADPLRVICLRRRRWSKG